MPPEIRTAVESWAQAREEKLTLSKAIVHLIERGLASEGVDLPALAASADASKPVPAAAAPPRKARPRRHDRI
jgi:hypothetical protein